MLRPREPERCQIHWAVTKHPKQRKKSNSVRENREKKGEAQEYDSLKSDLKFESALLPFSIVLCLLRVRCSVVLACSLAERAIPHHNSPCSAFESQLVVW